MSGRPQQRERAATADGELGLTVFLGDLEPGRQVWVEVVLPVKGAPRVDVGFEGEAGEEGEPDGRGLQDLLRGAAVQLRIRWRSHGNKLGWTCG